MRNRKRKGVYRIMISVENLTSPSAKKSSVCHFITGCTYFDCESEKRVQSRLIIHGDNIQLHGTELACMDGCGLQIHFLSSISALSILIHLFLTHPMRELLQFVTLANMSILGVHTACKQERFGNGFHGCCNY